MCWVFCCDGVNGARLQGCLSFYRAVSRRSAGPEVAPRSAARFAVSFAVLAFGGNLETRASAQTSKFLVPKSCALQARRPDWGTTPRPALRREYGFGLLICGEARRAIFELVFRVLLANNPSKS